MLALKTCIVAGNSVLDIHVSPGRIVSFVNSWKVSSSSALILRLNWAMDYTHFAIELGYGLYQGVLDEFIKSSLCIDYIYRVNH